MDKCLVFHVTFHTAENVVLELAESRLVLLAVCTVGQGTGHLSCHVSRIEAGGDEVDELCICRSVTKKLT